MIVYGADSAIADWVSEGLMGRKGGFSNSVALGVMHKDKLVAGVVYNNFQKKIDGSPLLIEMTIYSIDKIWCSRHNLNKLFCYPFAQLGLERVQAICSAQNSGVIMFLKRLGFTQEGVHPKGYMDGGDAVSFGMLKNNCKWISHG